MSRKFTVQQDGPNKYVLPKQGNMCCDVIAFLSPSLYEATNEGLWEDAYQSASFPGAKSVYLMPDCHKGYVLPVGGVLVTEDTIVQAGSGYDISCGVVYLQVPGLHASDVQDRDRRESWVREVSARVALGVGQGLAQIETGKPVHIDEVFQHGAAALGIPASQCERQYIPIGEHLDLSRTPRATAKAAAQLGSVGGGNHFIEMQVDPADGSVWIMIHCGSRGFGFQTAEHFFRKGAELRGLKNADREKSWLHKDEALGKEYWDHHNAAANYAIANRWKIVRGVIAATEIVYNKTPTPYFEISHNLVQEETLVLPDGTHSKGFVHRKGSTRAFPAGHPSLRGTRWESTGHPVLIPGSMLDGAAILFPLEGAYQSGCSVNHGSGRHMGRAEAKRELGPLQADIDQEMREIRRVFEGVEIVGIVGNTEQTPLDECGHVYKNLDEVLSVLVQNGIAKIERRLYPVANLKGTD